MDATATSTASRAQDYLFMVEQATRAPSGHNTQPWLFKENDSSIELRPDLSKAVPVVDRDNREMLISLGCATENLCIAAAERGYDSSVATDPSGTITVALEQSSTVAKSPLFAQIPVRQTNRSVYDGREIPADAVTRLQGTPMGKGIRLHLFAKGSPEFSAIKILVAKGNVAQMQDDGFKSELRSWIRFNKGHAQSTADGLSYAVIGAPPLPTFIARAILGLFMSPSAQNKGDLRKMDSSSHVALFTTDHDTPQEWVELGRNLQTFLLQSTALGIANAYMNQPCEIRELAAELKEQLKLPASEHPTILLRLGYARPMPYSLRREVRAVLIAP